MRQTDDEHCPKVFSEKYPNVGMVIDLTKDTPPYDANDLESRHIIYRKLATVSKVPPPLKIVRSFIDISKEFWEKYPDKEIAGNFFFFIQCQNNRKNNQINKYIIYVRNYFN